MKQINKNIITSVDNDREPSWCVFCDAKDRCDSCDATDSDDNDCGSCDLELSVRILVKYYPM